MVLCGSRETNIMFYNGKLLKLKNDRKIVKRSRESINEYNELRHLIVAFVEDYNNERESKG
jgi:hypothetical protein